MADFRTILHPTDFSEPAMYAFGLARALAKGSGAELLVVHVAPLRYRPRRHHRDETYEALCRLTNADPTLRMRPVLLEGDAAARIVGSANELDCDLIVMGTKGRRGLGRLLLGSVAAAVRKDAPCPVVAVQLPNRVGWELPIFADEQALTRTRRIARPGSIATRQKGSLCAEAEDR